MNDFYGPQYVHGDFSLSRWIIMHYCGDNISPVSNKRMLSTSIRNTLDSEQCRTTFVESSGLGSTFFVLSAGVHSCLFWAQISHRSFQVSFHDWPPYHGGVLLPSSGDFFFSSPWWVFSTGPSWVKFTNKIIYFSVFAGSFLFFWKHEHLYDFLYETEWITKHNIHRWEFSFKIPIFQSMFPK